MKIVKANKNQLEELVELQKQYMEHHKHITFLKNEIFKNLASYWRILLTNDHYGVTE